MEIIKDPIKDFIRLLLGLEEHEPVTAFHIVLVVGFTILLFLVLYLSK